MEHLINTYEELNTLGRPIGKMAQERMIALIAEAENLFIRPALTDDLWLKILDDNNAQTYNTLINGGTWADCRGSHMIMGLKKALAYFVYAQNLMAGDAQSTRYGMVIKNDEYSTPISDKERSQAYNNALEVGNIYLKECLRYAQAMRMFPCGSHHSGSGAVIIRKI